MLRYFSQLVRDVKKDAEDAEKEFWEAKKKYAELKNEVDNAAKVVKEIASEIQRQEHVHRVGNIVYSTTSLVSRCIFIASLALAPVTSGLSLAMGVGGSALGAGSAIANITHETVKDKFISEKLDEATKTLKESNRKWEELEKLLDGVVHRLRNVYPLTLKSCFQLKKIVSIAIAIQGICKLHTSSQVLHVLWTGKIKKLQNFLGIRKFRSAALTKVGSKFGVSLLKRSKGMKMVANKVVVPLTLIGAIMDVRDIVNNSKKISLRERSKTAEFLVESTEQMVNGVDEISDIFINDLEWTKKIKCFVYRVFLVILASIFVCRIYMIYGF
ncbi:hypothetical protein FSP39_019936 [Pinctada imbricata]|uniref:Apolipoprotein L3 n=1 Tax=Pinctada imbricata TaxID=66713 RepID=A0AA89BRK5_PINIB|nr:hypothetical protein FSP39_019936 [Pinctada imbricata]